MLRLHLLITLSIAAFISLQSQSMNVDCANAFTIPDPIEWCSESGEFDNTNAGGSEFTADNCLEGSENDLWFRFVAFAKAVNIVINSGSGGTLTAPRVAMYIGDCNSQITLLKCEASTGGNNIVNLFKGGLTLGETYFIRVSGQGSNQGSFQFCLNGYNPPIDPGQDAVTASNLCDKSNFVVQVLSGGGSDPDEAAGTCLDVGFGDTESQSTWFTWLAKNDGELTFSINPLNATDDLDWVLYEFPNGLNNLSGKINLRCMASSCIGPTGLNTTATDVNEEPGCAATDDNFLRALDQEIGKAYGILINNFTETGVGFELEFGGDAEFQGPEPDFNIDLAIGVDTTDGLTCDKLFTVSDNSTDESNSIAAYEWNFGEGANPQTASGIGPHDVSYESFGEKYVVLTVTSDRGCIVTSVNQLFAAKCCDDVEAIEVEASFIQAARCEDESNGSISVLGTGGFAPYKFSFEGGEFSSQFSFIDLEPGNYEIAVQDPKGCENSNIFYIIIAPPSSVNAGDDTSVEFLGDDIQLDASFMADGDVTISWDPGASVDCGDETTNCLDPIITPPGSSTYIISLLDENGCLREDSVKIDINNSRPIYVPNIFSPNDDGINDIFYVIGNSLSVLEIKEFVIFDRWGNKIYSIKNIIPSDISTGWDGRYNGDPARPGVYAWTARVIYLDTESADGELVTGDVTLVR